MWGVGAALSNVIAGWIVVAAGYDAAFISLGVVAAAGLTLYWAAMPETGPNAAAKGGRLRLAASPEWGRQAASKCYRRVASILRVRVPAKVTNTTLYLRAPSLRVSDLVLWPRSGSVAMCTGVNESLREVQ